MQTAVIIAASGQGQRMGTAARKQYMVLEGVPILARAIDVFVQHQSVIQVIVVIPPGEIAQARKVLKPFLPLEKLTFTEGGKRRQDSVYNGIMVASPEAELVCIHDGARPLLKSALVDSVIAAAALWGAAIPVIPLTDTLKQIAGSGLVKGTLSRENLRRAQTPQVFHRALIDEAYRKAQLLGVEATDDAYLVEMLGHAVYPVEGDAANIKITSPPDLLMAAALLKEGV